MCKWIGEYRAITLTTSAEVKALTTGNDTVDGSTTANVISGDTIIDTTSTDADILNVKMTSTPAVKATIASVETINLDFAGFGVTFDTSSVSGGKIVVSSSQVGNTTASLINGFNGTNITSVESSSGIKTLSVDDISNNAVIIAGTATTVNLNGLTDGVDSATLQVSGNTVTVSDAAAAATEELKNLTIKGSGSASTVTLDAGTGGVVSATGSVALTGDQSLTLKGTGAVLTGLTVTDGTTSGTTTVDITASAATMDLTKISSDVIKFSGLTTTHEATFSNNATASFNWDGAAVVLDIKSATAATVFNATVAGDASLTDDATHFTTVNLTMNDSNTPNADGTDLTFAFDTDVTVNLFGATNVDINATSVALKKVNAAAMTGNIKAAVDAATIDDLVCGSGDDNVTLTTTAHAVTVDGGNGSDTFISKASIANVVLSNFEVIDMANTNVTASKDSTFSGKAIVIKSTGDQDANLAITSISSTTIDLSNITIDNTTMGDIAVDGAGKNAITLDASAQTLSMNISGSKGDDSIEGGTNADILSGNSGADLLEGNAGADQISGGEGADTILGGAGDDTIQLAEIISAADTVDFVANATGKDTITGFTTGKDKLSFDGITVTGGGDNIAAIVGTAVTAGSVVAGALDGVGAGQIYVINNGAVSLVAAGSKTVTDYTSTTVVATYLNEGYTSTADNDCAIFIINDLAGAKSYVYLFDEQTAGASTIQAADLTLVGVITETSGGALVAGDIA